MMPLTRHCLPLACAVIVAACHTRTTPEQPAASVSNRACLVAASADARGDEEIIRLQQGLSQPRVAPLQ